MKSWQSQSPGAKNYNRGRCLALTLSGLLLFSADGRSAEENSHRFHLHPALEIELLAAEPDLVDPVALTFDAHGRMYVVEMRDYPEGIGEEKRAGGTVRLLEDTNQDGKMDRVTLFAQNLSFPTSIAPWAGGVLVTAPPDILFLEDSTGDGKADIQRVILSGFRLGVTDSNVNGLRWGLDNRVHGVNGGHGGSIVSPLAEAAPRDIRNFDFSFVPASGDFTTTYRTGGGFGLVFDEWGRSFTTHNLRHILHRVLPVRYLGRFPGMPPVNPTIYISDHSDSSELPSYAQTWGHGIARIYPISPAVPRPNHPEQAGHFSAAGGMGYIGASHFPGDLPGSILICDVVGNLVHRDILHPNGPTFIASRSSQEQSSEFLAGEENQFRPVGLELGPDGALYLIDMHRAVIEHPNYIPDKMKAGVDLREGENLGRIYRIVPAGGLPSVQPRLQQASTLDLVGRLDHPNQWWRITAQRLLFERQDQSAVEPLKKFIQVASPLGRLHAFWTLQGLGALDPEMILEALKDPHPGVRENAVRLAEFHLGESAALRDRLLQTASDADPRVRFQTALTLGELDHPQVENSLLEIAAQDAGHYWTGIAVLSSLREGREGSLLPLLQDARFKPIPSTLEFIKEWAALTAARSNSSTTLKILKFLNEEKSPWRVALLEGLDQGFKRASRPLERDPKILEQLEALSSNELDQIQFIWSIRRAYNLPETEADRAILAKAIQAAADLSEPIPFRVAAVNLLGLASFPAVRDTLFNLLDGKQPAAVQGAVVQVLQSFDDPAVATELVKRWRFYGPAVRHAVVHLLLRRTSFHHDLLDAVESGHISLGELNLDLEQRRRLLRQSNPEIRARAGKLMGDEEYSNRKELVEQWLASLPASGDAAKGRLIFENSCSSCHSFRGAGHAVGPDLSDARVRSIEDLVSHTLDPNMAIHPNYTAYLVELESGEIETGLLHSESEELVKLLQAHGREVEIPRRNIVRMVSTGISMMPEGLEAAWTPQDLRDLITYLQQ